MLQALAIVTAYLTLANGGFAGGIFAQDSTAAPMERVTRKLRSGEPLVFATFGDSITLPCYHTDYRQNYITLTVDALRKAYPAARVAIVHAGNMGTAARGLAAGRFDKHVLHHRPDVVFLMFGMNDCAAGPDGLDGFERNLVELIERARSNGALPVIVTQNEIIYDSDDGRRRAALPLYQRRAKDVAARMQIPAVDCFSEWQTLARNRTALIARLNDWIHPNLAGHRLFARSIVTTLWPDAMKFVYDGERSLSSHGDWTAGISPGPRGKQILRTSNGTWVALSGRYRNQLCAELILSFARRDEPHWDEFQHIPLIGTGQDAIFDASDRNLTGALLLERQGVITVLFSWNVGTCYLTLDTTRSGWFDRLRDAGTWLGHTSDPFIRPTVLTSSNRDGVKLFDGYLQRDGRPAAFCTDLKLADWAGYEIVEGEEVIALISNEMGAGTRFPPYHALQSLQTFDGRIQWFAQRRRGSPWQTGYLGSPEVVAIEPGGAELMVPATGDTLRGVLRGGPASNSYTMLRYAKGAFAVDDLKAPDAGRVGYQWTPLPWSDGVREGIHWLAIPGPKTPVAYESRLPAGATALGALVYEQRGLQFLVQSVSDEWKHP